MKKTFLLVLLSLLNYIGITAQTVGTTGTLSVTKTVSLTPGEAVDEEEGFFTISFDDVEDTYYTAYQMDLYLPDGYEFAIPDGWEDCAVLNEDGGVYPKVSRKIVHTLASSLRSPNHLFVMVIDGSYKNKSFIEHSGDLFDVYVKATPYAKPGDFQVTIEGIKFVAADENGYLYTNHTLTVGSTSAESPVPVKISAANKISTAIFPFSCDLPDGLEAYTTDGTDGEYINLVKTESISAFTPYILYSESGIDETLSGTIDAVSYPASTSVSDGCITGVLASTEVAAGYVLQNKGEGPMFYKIGSTSFTIPAGRCYANPLSAGANARALAFRFGGEEANGIQSVAVDKGSKAIFDLQGNPVLNPQSGCIYIIEGKKVLKR